MLQKLKLYSAKKATRSYLENHVPKPVRKIKSVAVIFEATLKNKLSFIQKISEHLEIDNTIINAIIYNNTLTAENHTEKLPVFSNKELSWQGKFKKDSLVKEFQEKNYDLLINYFTNPSEELLALSASVKANLKVGFPLAEQRLNDLDIAVDLEEKEVFIQELKKYLSIINQ